MARGALYEELIGDLADRGTTALVTTHDVDGIEPIADRVGILYGAALVVNAPTDDLKEPIRRIRCAGSAGAFSWEPFEHTAVVEREWGRETVVTNFTEDRLEAFLARTGSSDVDVSAMSLEEIFVLTTSAPGARP